MRPARVQRSNATSITSRGSTQTAGPGILGRHRPVERAVRPPQRLQPPGEHPQRLVGEPGADVPAVHSSAPASSAVQPTSSEPISPVLLPLPGFQPATTTSWPSRFLSLSQLPDLAPGSYARVEPLDHHALEPVRHRGGQHGVQVLAGESWAGQPAASVRDERLEQLLRSRVGQAGERAPVQLQHVERQVGDRGHARASRSACAGEETCIRGCSASKSGRPPVKATISPSSSACLCGRRRGPARPVPGRWR